MQNRRLLVRAVVLLLFVALGVFFFVNGKGHDILLDNKTVTVGDRTYEAFASARISLDGRKSVEIQRRERLPDMLVGKNHAIRVEVLNRGGQVIQTVEEKFSLGLERTWLISLPLLVSGDANWIQVFQHGQ